MAAVAALAGACAAAPKPVPPPPPASPDAAFLLPPATGYTAVGDPDLAARVNAAYRRLTAPGGAAAAAEVAAQVAERDPGYAPAEVLAAQAELLTGRAASAARRLEPLCGEAPAYTACQVTLGRAAEVAGEIPLAFEAYRRAEEGWPPAAGHAARVHDRAVEIVVASGRDALARGRQEAAEAALQRLHGWHLEETPAVLAFAMDVAHAGGDGTAELAAARQLATLEPGEVTLLERLANLELEVGDADRALTILEGLTAKRPDDRRLADRLEAAKFRWRLRVLPEDVQRLAAKGELARGDMALLLYWLVPGVRAGVVESGTIAGDILEHPFRQAIARVINLRLMEVDEAVHRFFPDRPLLRVDALRSLLRVLERAGPRFSCLDPSPLGWRSADAVCAAAGRCGLLGEAADCLPEAVASGPATLEWIRRTVALQAAP